MTTHFTNAAAHPAAHRPMVGGAGVVMPAICEGNVKRERIGQPDTVGTGGLIQA